MDDLQIPPPQCRADFEAQRAGELAECIATDTALVALLREHDPAYDPHEIVTDRERALRALRKAGFELVSSFAIRREMLSDSEFIACIERLATLTNDTDPAITNAVFARLADLIEARTG